MTAPQALPLGLALLPEAGVREARTRDSSPAGARDGSQAFQSILSDLAGEDETVDNRPADREAGDGPPGNASALLSLLKKAVGEAAPRSDEEKKTDARDEKPLDGGVQSSAALLTALQLGRVLADGNETQGADLATDDASPADDASLPSTAVALESLLASDDPSAEKTDHAGAGQGAVRTRADVAAAFAVKPEETSLDISSLATVQGSGTKVHSRDDTALSVSVAVQKREAHFAPVYERSAQHAVSLGIPGMAKAQTTEASAASDFDVTVDEDASSAESVSMRGSDGLPRIDTHIAVSAGSGAGRGKDGALDDKVSAPADAQASGEKSVGSSAELFAVPRPATASAGSGEPVSQIVRRVAAELAGDQTTAAAPRSEAANASGSVLKVLHLRLEPGDLGSVTVRMDLKNDSISLHLQASHPDTARAIERDREMLSNALKSAGYVVDGITSQTVEAPRGHQVMPSASADSQSGLSSSSQSQSGMAQARGQGGGGQQRDPQGGAYPQGAPVNEGRGEGTQKVRDALYV